MLREVLMESAAGATAARVSALSFTYADMAIRGRLPSSALD